MKAYSMGKVSTQMSKVSKTTEAGRWAKRLIHRSKRGRKTGNKPKMQRMGINSEL